MKGKNLKQYILLGIIIVSSLVIVLYLAVHKRGMHEDEFYTYILSNYGGDGLAVQYPNGVKVNAKECFDEYFYAREFNVKNIWNNQKKDVHPPFYYLIFHIFGLVTCHYGNLKSGIILNGFFHGCNILIIYIILRKLLHRTDLSLLGCGLYAMMPAVLGNVIFIRMYTLLSMFVLLLVLCLVDGMQEGMGIKFWIPLGAVSMGGILTHYYFIIYLFYSCLVFCFWLLMARMWKQLGGFLATMCVAAGGSCIIFPYMLSHIFSGYRGEQSFDNLLHSLWGESLKYFVAKLDAVFGGLLLATIIIACVCFVKNVRLFVHGGKANLILLLMILIPCILYFLTVTKIAVLKSERYITPLYGVSIILMIWGIKSIAESVFINENAIATVVICMVGIMLGSSWKTYTWSELHLEAESCMNLAKQYGQENDCIDIYDKAWESISAFGEFAQYQAISFIPINELELLDLEYFKEYDHVVVYMDSEMGEEQINSILAQIINNSPKLDTYVLLYQYQYQSAYYLE